MVICCPECKRDVVIRHLHDTAHDVVGTHIIGSERFECPECGHHLTRDDVEILGLKYALDL